MRPSGAITIPARPRPPGPRSGPPGLAGPIAAQLDRAHAALGSAPLAELLLILRDPAQRLAEGRAAPLSGAERRALGRLQPGVRGPLLSALRLLRLAGEEGGTAAFGRWLATYVEEVAARPRGAAVPHPEAPRRSARPATPGRWIEYRCSGVGSAPVASDEGGARRLRRAGPVGPREPCASPAAGRGAEGAVGVPMSEEERSDEARSLLRQALEEVVDELGERLRRESLQLAPGAISAVSEALTAAYVRGLDHGLRQAARDLEERLEAMGVPVRELLKEPPQGEEPPPAT